MIAYLKLFRLPLVFTAVADSLAGYLSVRGLREGDGVVLLCLALTSGGLYAFGMGMNDVADRERDRELAPGRPLPSGRISLPGALSACSLAFTISLGALVFNPAHSEIMVRAWLVAVVGILVYDFAVKIPPIMGAIRAANFLIGATAWQVLNLREVTWAAYYWPAIGLFVYGTSLTFVSTLEDGSLRKRVLWLGAAGMAAGALLPAAVELPKYWHGLVPAVLLVAWVFWRASRAADKKGIMLMVRDGVAGFILLDASLVTRFQEPWLGLAIAALLLPAFGLIALFKRLG